MKTIVASWDLDDEELAEAMVPRTGLAAERQVAPGHFALIDGPFDAYDRRVEVEAGEDGRHRVTQTLRYELAIPVWGPLFRPLVRHAARARPVVPAPGEVTKPPWWSPPDVLDRRAVETLSWLCVFSVFTGYLGVLLSQLNTYFKEDFGSTNSQIGNVSIAVRLGALLALAVVAFADRRGRRRVLLAASVAAVLLTVAGAFAPNLWVLGGTQTLARGFVTSVGILVGIMAVEEMPPNSRAFAVSVLVMSAALGAGGVVVPLGLADLTPWAWRVFYFAPLVLLWPIARMRHRLHETRRFEVYDLAHDRSSRSPAASSDPPTDPTPPAETTPLAPPAEDEDILTAAARAGHLSPRKRFALLGGTNLLTGLFTTPAGFYMNEFLRVERGFKGFQITLLQVLTNLPGGLAIVVGGRLADKRGRRLVGAVSIAGGVGFTVLMYLGTGASIWLFSTLATLLGAAAVPALGVYGPELFGTGSRGVANGGLSLLGVIGAVIGLQTAAALADRWGSFSPAMAVLGLGPLVVVFLIILFYPETAHRELEELNPEDAPPPVAPIAVAELDAVYATEHPEDEPLLLHHEHRTRPGREGREGREERTARPAPGPAPSADDAPPPTDGTIQSLD